MLIGDRPQGAQSQHVSQRRNMAGPGAVHAPTGCPIEALLATGTVFHESWWREAVTEAPAGLAVVERGGRILGAMPYQTRRRHGLVSIGQPGLSHVLGPVVEAAGGGAGNAIRRNIEITGELARQLPSHTHCFFRLHDGISESLGFNLAGFDNGADFTIRIAPAEERLLWGAMRDKTRNVVRRATDLHEVRDIGADAFIDLYGRNLAARQTANAYDPGMLRRALRAAVLRQRGRCLAAHDRSGEPMAAVFTVWDARSEYYLLSTRTSSSSAGAVSLLIWHALREAASNGRTFDLDGIHVHGENSPNLLLLTGFGGTIASRITVRHLSRLAGLARSFWITRR